MLTLFVLVPGRLKLADNNVVNDRREWHGAATSCASSACNFNPTGALDSVFERGDWV
ncbi:MAG: hypothetical protein ABJ311_13590 [Erythrobacter sp.]